MKRSTQSIVLFLLLIASCKRSPLEIAETEGIKQPASGSTSSTRSLEEERESNLSRQKTLDEMINVLKESLVNSKNLSAAQKEELQEKIAVAQQEKTRLDLREQELNAKLNKAENELREARQRNEELKKELAKAKAEKAANGGNSGTGDTDGVPALGPYEMFNGDFCLAIKDKSLAEGALFIVELCKDDSLHQQFMFNLADEKTGAYRINAISSQKCLRVADSSDALGAKLIQSTCSPADKSQTFFILGINETDFLLQSAKSQYCFDRQADKTLAQVVCDFKLETNFQIDTPKSREYDVPRDPSTL